MSSIVKEDRTDRERIRDSELNARRGGILRSAVFLGLFVSALCILLWMLAAPQLIRMKLEGDTQFSWEAKRLSCNPFGFDMRIEDAVLGNSTDFGEGRPMMRIRSFETSGSFKSLISGPAELDVVSLDISRLSLIIDERGALNLERFVEDLLGESRGLREGLKISDCRLKVDTVEIIDYSSPRPSHKALKLGVDVEGFSAESAIGLFDPLFEIMTRSD